MPTLILVSDNSILSQILNQGAGKAVNNQFIEATCDLVEQSYRISYRNVTEKDITPLRESVVNMLAAGWLPCGAVAGVLSDGTLTSKLFVRTPDGDVDIAKLFMNQTGRHFKFQNAPVARNDWGQVYNVDLKGDYRFGAGIHSLALLARKYDGRITDTTSMGGISFVKYTA
jgi:hypothetical protein